MKTPKYLKWVLGITGLIGLILCTIIASRLNDTSHNVALHGMQLYSFISLCTSWILGRIDELSEVITQGEWVEVEDDDSDDDQIEARYAALDDLYQHALQKGCDFPPELRALFHEHMNKYTDLKNKDKQ